MRTSVLTLLFVFVVASFATAADKKPAAKKPAAKKPAKTVKIGAKAPAFKIKGKDGKRDRLGQADPKGTGPGAADMRLRGL